MSGLQWIKNAVRAKDILRTLVRHGFWDVVDKVDGKRAWIGRLAPPAGDETATVWVRLRRVLEDLGPTFVKLGQLAATREDALPEPLVVELRKLRETVGALPWEAMEPVLRDALPGAVTAHFMTFDTRPVAAGSLGQVYRAELSGGLVVAVKIRRPGIVGAVKADLDILQRLADAAHQRVPELRSYDLPAVVAESAAGLMRELRFSATRRATPRSSTALNANGLVFRAARATRLFAPRASSSPSGSKAARRAIRPSRRKSGNGSRRPEATRCSTRFSFRDFSTPTRTPGTCA